jgi:hypothetical protein
MPHSISTEPQQHTASVASARAHHLIIHFILTAELPIVNENVSWTDAGTLVDSSCKYCKLIIHLAQAFSMITSTS